MSLIRQHQQIEVLVCLDERIDDQQRVVWRHVIIESTVRQQQVSFKILRHVLISLIVVVGLAAGVAHQQALIPFAPVVFIFAIVMIA